MRKWTNEQIEYLKEIALGKLDQQIADMINNRFETNYTKSAIQSMKRNLKIISNAKYCNKYTDEVIQFIIENSKGIDNIKLAELVNKEFNLNVDNTSIANVKSRILKSLNINLRNGINRGCFKKEQVSFNKGKKWNDYMSEKGQANAKKTCFKKGNIPHNHREVGSERINVDGYYEIKVAEPNVWKLKHRIIYENAYGSIPEEYLVTFADGNKNNLNLDNLVLISKSENLHMNKDSLRFNDPELTKTGLNITKIKLKIGEKKNRN